MRRLFRQSDVNFILDKNPNDIINFNIQPEMANRLGYNDRGLKNVKDL